MEKEDASEREKYRGLELTDPILKIVERVIEKLIRQQSGIDVMHFCFMPGFETTNTVFLRQLQEIYLGGFVTSELQVTIFFVRFTSYFLKTSCELLFIARATS